MSCIVSPDNTEFLTEVDNPDGGLDVVGQLNEENFIEIKCDAPVGVIGGKLDDIIITGAGGADVFTRDGDDIITAGTGNDILRGGDGDDIIRSGLGADILIGGNGNDVLKGDRGGVDEDGNLVGDTLKGGAGEDIFEFSAGESEFKDGEIDKIVDFQADGFADAIEIFGVGDEGSVNYNPETGLVEINETTAIDIGKNLDINVSKMEDNGTWELF